MVEPTKSKRAMPKGGRKGGSVFPRISLGDALQYSRKLVAKSHTGTVSVHAVYAAVNAKSGLGDVRISALRQFGLLEGTEKSGYRATELARKIGAAPESETKPLLRDSCLKPKVFAKLFETFHGDTILRAKLRQRASDLRVHPEELDKCVAAFVNSLEFAGLATTSGDQITIVGKSAVAVEEVVKSELDTTFHEEIVQQVEEEAREERRERAEPHENEQAGPQRNVARPTVSVSINVDSTMDPEKLAKQLELLKKFGAI